MVMGELFATLGLASVCRFGYSSLRTLRGKGFGKRIDITSYKGSWAGDYI